MKAQVWVETVIYTVIGLSLIGAVLAFVTPKIQEYRDKAIIEQSMSSLNLIDSKIQETLQAPLNTRIVELRFKRGDLYFNAINDSISIIIDDSEAIFSQPGEIISIGKIKVLTEKRRKTNRVSLFLNYTFNLDYENNQSIRKYSPASTPYKFSFTNVGYSDIQSGERKPTIFIREVSSR
jgi:type II secretory pathway pseudopilin PulG